MRTLDVCIMKHGSQEALLHVSTASLRRISRQTLRSQESLVRCAFDYVWKSWGHYCKTPSRLDQPIAMLHAARLETGKKSTVVPMADLKLDNEFGSELAGAGSRPAFAHLVRFRPKDITQKEFPTTLTLTNVSIQVGAAPVNPNPNDKGERPVTEDTPFKCMFRIANESFTTDSFIPGQEDWQGSGCVRFMLASSVILLVRVLVADSTGKPYGYARLRLGRVGEGEFQVAGEIKETEYVSIQDQLLGYITINFKVTPNFSLNLAKLDNQFDTKNIPSLISVVSADSKTLGHRIGAFQGALQVLQSIVLDMQRQGGIGAIAGKQLSVILDQASSAQGIELFEDLLWDMATLSFVPHVFQPTLTFFPGDGNGDDTHKAREEIGEGVRNTTEATEASVCAQLARYPRSFALVRDGEEPVILVADTDSAYHRWTVVLRIACQANSEMDAEKAKKLVIPEYCKDPVHPDHPTAGWLRRKKRDRRALTSSFVNRFFRLEYDAHIMRYTFSYGKEPSDDATQMTKVGLDDGTSVLLPNVPPVPTPFALQVVVQQVSDFSFSEHDSLTVVAQLGSLRQCTRAFCPKESTSIQSNMLLPVEEQCLAYGNTSVSTGNVGWFGEDVTLPEKQEGGDKKFELLRFFIGEGQGANAKTAVATCSVPFSDLQFGRQQDMSLSLKGPEVEDAEELTVGITMRRLGQYKTAWPATMTALLQAGSTTSTDQTLWEGPCMVRTAPQGLEVFRPTANPEEPNKAIMTIDYYSVEAMTDVNASTLDIAVIVEDESSSFSTQGSARKPPKPPGSPGTPSTLPPPSPLSDPTPGSSPIPGTPGVSPGAFSRSGMFGLDSPAPTRPNLDRRGSFGMVTRKGKSLSPSKSPIKDTRLRSTNGRGDSALPKKVTVPHDYFILRISPCPAEALKDLVSERRWMFKCRNMLLYITNRLHQLKQEEETHGEGGPLASDRGLREKLAIASAETYKMLRADMSEIIKTSDWKRARGVGFTEKQIRMFFRLQRMSVYFAKLLESKAHPLWGLDNPIDPTGFARQDLDRVFSSQYVQSGTFGAEAQGIENSVKGVGWALKSLNRRFDETKLFYNNSPEDIVKTSRMFFQEYFLRCTGELGAHVISDNILKEVPIEVVVAFVCFLVKRDNAFHDLLVDNCLEPDTNAFLTSILSIDSMIRRLTKRTELEIMAQWPNEGDISEDATPAYLTSLLEDCSPDAENDGKLSTRAPEELMKLLEKYVPLISSQCRARGNLGAKIFEGMFAAMPSFATTAAAAVFALNHASSKDTATRYLAAFLNDMTRSAGLVQEMIDGSEEHLHGIPIDVPAIQGGMFSAGVEVACLLADVALLEMDAVCAEFFQADWYADDENAVMRKACKLLNVGIARLESQTVKEPFFDHVIGAATEKIAFRYLAGLVHRCKDHQSGGKMMTEEELERMHNDVEMMQSYVAKYGQVGVTSVLHLKEAITFLTEKPEIIQQVVFVDILKRHEGKEEHVMSMLKTLTAVRDDLRNFFVPAWLNKLTQKQTAVVQERQMMELEGDGRACRIAFDAFEWVFRSEVTQPKDAYVYKYLMQCLQASRVQRGAQ